MVVSNGLFDALLFGALLVGLGIDYAFPGLQGTAFLLACGGALYMAAQEWAEALTRRKLWTQEPLSTAVALSCGGFLYFLARNSSDFSLLILSIGLMMASLMLSIGTIAAFSSAAASRSPKPVFGYILTVGGALIMGGLAGLLTFDAPVVNKAIAVAVAFALWKVREKIAPPNPQGRAVAEEAAPPLEAVSEIATHAAKTTAEAAVTVGTLGTVHGLPLHNQGRWQLIPTRGTLLDRFLPVLLLGAVIVMFAHQPGGLLQSVTAPASANGATAENSTETAPSAP